MQTCNPGFCTYSQINYTGDPRAITDTGCWSFVVVPYRRSYINNTNFEGYFYSNNNCTGQSKPVTYYSRSRDIGFAAGSFRVACVSCRSEGQ
jgi:hypothetical protein